ncbi:ASCH domain-containing protein [Pseudomonas sp. SWRI74]|uniref:ASCH domain-containing protein n=1 Tax=Pseudomonas azerbaijanoccidentalis TaxID=2842347 RepID=A0ABS6R0H8_9PSED|nr:ASCH domain-containing protein [Pseudomonas azerbaijanoccidentalis]MBV4524397.1 ASCH domain-containing protein [Pseudomonas azerbaijanoccidentalis]
MKTLSIRQPWAWLIIHGGKDIENRSWLTKFRGRFLVHASKGMTKQEYADAAEYAQRLGVTVPPAAELLRGGIIGSVEAIGSDISHPSPWYMPGNKAIVLRDPRPLPFISVNGRLGFFDVPCAIPETHKECLPK